MMFGDIGHGFLLFLLGCYMCFFYESIKKSDSMIKGLLPARYLVLLMGFFAFYCGMIYNDITSVSLNLFGSCYDMHHPSAHLEI
jgi:V-type H+-transporting ATPase subunit a